MRHFSALVSQAPDVTSSGGWPWMQLGGARSPLLPHGEEDGRSFAPKASCRSTQTCMFAGV